MNEQGDRPNDRHDQPMGERRLFVVLCVFGVAALFFGFFQIVNSIRGPFAFPKNANETTLSETGSTISSLKKKDTDNDGLSDFDELYVYHTSPYLADSDSDSSSDQQEVFGGTDPNCPQGQNCSALAGVNVSGTNENVNEDTNSTLPLEGNTNAASAETNASTTLPSGLSIDDLRLALKNAGAPETTINGMSDAELLDLYQQVVGPSGMTTNTTTNASATTNGSTTNSATISSNANLPATLDESTMQNLTPAQIRQLLIQGGADAATINQVDDATLQEIFQKALLDMQAAGT
ncbi:MAG: hypothetical protein V1778_05045 [bacterium]